MDNLSAEQIMNAIYECMGTVVPVNELTEVVNGRKPLIGTKLAEQFDRLLFEKDMSQFRKQLYSGKILYRARQIHPERYVDKTEKDGLLFKESDNQVISSGFNRENSIEAPLGRGNEGRNNIEGMPYLYVASDAGTACAEIKTLPLSVISVAEFKVIKDLNIIDFSSDGVFDSSTYQDGINLAVLFTAVMRQFMKPINNSEDYKPTQVLSDYIRKAGFDGVGYKSFYGSGVNYTIFNSHPRFISFQSSRVFYHYGSASYFWDCNNQKMHSASNRIEINEAGQSLIGNAVELNREIGKIFN